ncbi:MAG: LacI family DNA-binding transcriptional regulator [Lachnospiraceae bacterium]|nr:LacI family DNA-binding transcriptional regulator [Lachnospiraceae bacterium]
MNKVTIKEVAKEAGVSISTVSNALNDVDVLHPDTKAHVLEVAKRLHYIPNLNGRNLKSGATKVIGMFVTYMGGPYMGALADSMAKECSVAGYELNVFVTARNQSIMANLLGHRVDGAVIDGSILTKEEENALQEAELPVVYLNKEIAGAYQAGVFFDSYEAGRMAAKHLLSKGFKRLGFIKGNDNYDGKERSRGFFSVLEEQHISLEEEFILQGGFMRDLSYRNTKRFLESRGMSKENLPQAFFAANDLSAIGCMEALLQAGLRIPEDIGLMGCDDIELDKYLQPALTTIRTNFEEQGIQAVRALLEMLAGEKQGSLHKLDCRLISRQSA